MLRLIIGIVFDSAVGSLLLTDLRQSRPRVPVFSRVSPSVYLLPSGTGISHLPFETVLSANGLRALNQRNS